MSSELTLSKASQPEGITPSTPRLAVSCERSWILNLKCITYPPGRSSIRGYRDIPEVLAHSVLGRDTCYDSSYEGKDLIWTVKTFLSAAFGKALTKDDPITQSSHPSALFTTVLA